VRHALQRSLLAIAPPMAAGLSRFVPDAQSHRIFYEHGFHLLRRHYYLPIPDASDLGDGFWNRESQLIGVDMNDSAALDLLTHVFPKYMGEFRSQFPEQGTAGRNGFHLINGNYMAVDAHVYYAFIRHLKPRRIVEIGSGFSTLLAGAACLKNQEENGEMPHLTAIEPYPPQQLKTGCGGLSELLERKVQEVPLDTFTSLAANDILFIDSSHVLREGGDVQFEFCEILPRLAPGVLVHVHDISLPRAYPRVYFDQRFYWNEQYLLQAFLAFNSRFEVLWPGNYMTMRYPELVSSVFPEYHTMRAVFPSSEPAAFWMRARDM
jgi:hypothetical protein